MPTAIPTGLWVRDAELEQRPPVVNWVVADAAARTALVSGSGLKQFDVAYQSDTGTAWISTNAPSVAPSSWIQISGAPGSSGAPTNAPYVTMALSSDLSQERALAGEDTVISITDGGANGNVVVGIVSGGIVSSKYADLSVIQSKIGNNAVGNAQFRQIPARSIFGNPTASTANGQDITAGAVGNILRYAGTTIGFGTVSLSDSGSVTVPGLDTNILFKNGSVVGASSLDTINTVDQTVTIGSSLIVGGDLYLSSVHPSPIGADQSNYSSTTDNIVWKIEPTANVLIHGLYTGAPYFATRGKTFALLNISSSFSFTLKNQSATATDVNRFDIGEDIVIGPHECAIIWYDAGIFRWKMIAHSVPPSAAVVPPPFVLSNPTVASNEFDDETIAVIEDTGGGTVYDFSSQGVYTVSNAKSSGNVTVGGGGSFALVGGGVVLTPGQRMRAVAFSFGGAGNVAYRIDNASGSGGSTDTLIEDTTEYTIPNQWDDELLAYDASADLQKSVKLRNVVYPYNFTREWVLFNDFNNSASGLNDGLSSTTSGTTGAAHTANASDGSAFGVCQSQTGSDATGRAGFITSSSIIRFGDCVARYYHRLRINLGLSDGTNTYVIRTGFGDQGGGEHTDGVYFRYTHTESSGNWTCVCRSNGTETTADSTTAPTTGTTWQTLEIRVGESGATTADFYINGTWKAAISTNVPNGAGRETAVSAGIIKSLGGGSRAFESDYIFASIMLNTPRTS